MSAIYTMVGLVLGILLTMAVITIYNAIEDDREEQARQWQLEKERRRKMRQELNAPRDRQEQKIIDQAQKGLQRRDEG